MADQGQQPRPGRPPEPGEPEAEEEEEEEESEVGRLDLNRLEMGGEDEDFEPRFLGDSALLYSHDAPGSTPSRQMMVFHGTVSGHQAVVLLDLGANANFVSQQWARSKACTSGR